MSVEFYRILYESPGHVGFSTFFRYFLSSTYLGGLKGSMRLYCVIARELPIPLYVFLPTQLLLLLLVQVNMMLALGSVDILFFSLFVSSMGLGSRAPGSNPPALALSLSLSLFCQGNISSKCVGLRYRNDPPTSFSSSPSSSQRSLYGATARNGEPDQSCLCHCISFLPLFLLFPSSRIPGTSHLILEFRLVFVRVHDQCPESLTFPSSTRL